MLANAKKKHKQTSFTEKCSSYKRIKDTTGSLEKTQNLNGIRELSRKNDRKIPKTDT